MVTDLILFCNIKFIPAVFVSLLGKCNVDGYSHVGDPSI